MRTKLLVMFIAVEICQAAIIPMDQNTLKSYIENGSPFDFILIDVRSREEVKAGIGNGACKPYNLAWPTQFQVESAKIPKDQAIIIYCESGGRAARAAAYLSNNGYTRVYNAGGMLTWTGPTVPAFEVKSASLLPEPSMRAATSEMPRQPRIWAFGESSATVPNLIVP